MDGSNLDNSNGTGAAQGKSAILAATQGEDLVRLPITTAVGLRCGGPAIESEKEEKERVEKERQLPTS